MYQKDLEAQLEEDEYKKKAAYEEFLREKELVDEIVARIYEEDRSAAEQNLHRKQHTRRELEEFEAKRNEWRRREEEAVERENAAIREYVCVWLTWGARCSRFFLNLFFFSRLLFLSAYPSVYLSFDLSLSLFLSFFLAFLVSLYLCLSSHRQACALPSLLL